MPHVLYVSGERTARTQLILPSESTGDFLFSLAMQSGEAWAWKGRPPLRRNIDESIWSDTFEHAVIVDLASGQLCGYVAIHAVNLFHGIGYMSLYLDSRARGRGFPFEAAALLIQRTFDYTTMVKLYTESTDDTASSFGRGVFTQEGRLRDYRLVRGVRRDLVVSAVSRDDWNDRIRPALALSLTPRP